MTDLTVQEKNQVETGARRFIDELLKSAPDLVEEGFAATTRNLAPDTTFLDRFTGAMGDVANTRFSNATQTLLQEEQDSEATTLQSAGVGGPRLGHFVLRSFRKRLCNPSNEAELNAEIAKVKKEHGLDITPTAAGISSSAATAVAVTIGSLLGSGPLAVVLAPLAGAVALLLLLVGVDTFCGWAASKEAEPPSSSDAPDTSGHPATGSPLPQTS